MAGFEDVVGAEFPDAMPGGAFAGRSYNAFYRFGFNRESALAIVSICRDELAQPISATIREHWGECFNLGGLAGMPLAGRTAVAAARDHAPTVDGRARTAFFALAHVGIDEDGQLGRHVRRGQLRATPACGALSALVATGERSRPSPESAADDVEFEMLRLHLADAIGESQGDLLRLTMKTHAIISEMVDRLARNVLDPTLCDHAVATGVQIHGPGGLERVWPGALHVVCSGERTDLNWS